MCVSGLKHPERPWCPLPPVQWVKRPWREVDHEVPSSTKAENDSCTFILSYAFMTYGGGRAIPGRPMSNDLAAWSADMNLFYALSAITYVGPLSGNSS